MRNFHFTTKIALLASFATTLYAGKSYTNAIQQTTCNAASPDLLPLNATSCIHLVSVALPQEPLYDAAVTPTAQIKVGLSGLDVYDGPTPNDTEVYTRNNCRLTIVPSFGGSFEANGTSTGQANEEFNIDYSAIVQAATQIIKGCASTNDTIVYGQNAIISEPNSNSGSDSGSGSLAPSEDAGTGGIATSNTGHVGSAVNNSSTVGTATTGDQNGEKPPPPPDASAASESGTPVMPANITKPNSLPVLNATVYGGSAPLPIELEQLQQLPIKGQSGWVVTLVTYKGGQQMDRRWRSW